MKINKKMLPVLTLAGMLVGLAACYKVDTEEKRYYNFNEKNELLRPTDYRTWVFAGTGTTPKSYDHAAIFPDFQNIYIDPESYRFWKENGYYRNGTIFVKELIHQGDSISPIGKGFFQGEAYSVAAAIKDSIRFPDVPGGWQYFDYFSKDGVLLGTSPALGGACISCHAKAAAGYGAFTEFYLPLRDAKGFGKGNPENLDTRKTAISNAMKEIK